MSNDPFQVLPESLGDIYYAPDMDDEAFKAAVDLIGRTGAKGFEVGFLHDDVPPEEAGWYAHAQYEGARVTCEDQPGPVEAAEGLARKLLDGGMCTHCRRPVVLGRGKGCRWSRYRDRWVRGCETR